MKTDVRHLYFDWLIHAIWDENGWKVKTHRKLLKKMNNFLFMIKIPNDVYRVNDGIDIRWRFAWESGHLGDNLICSSFGDDECSVLEMMIALAFRANESMANQNGEPTVQHIFWDMVKNLGLLGETDNMYDEENVSYMLKRFNERLYQQNGKGGLFYFPYNDTDDMRKIEIWDQLCWYVNEYYSHK